MSLPTIFQDIDDQLLQKFKVFHIENPDIYATFRRYALKIKQTGRKKYSGWTIINAIRWDHDIKTSGDVFKINNDFIALYTRLLIFHEPSFEGFFELRKMKASDRRYAAEERYRRLSP